MVTIVVMDRGDDSGGDKNRISDGIRQRDGGGGTRKNKANVAKRETEGMTGDGDEREEGGNKEMGERREGKRGRGRRGRTGWGAVIIKGWPKQTT